MNGAVTLAWPQMSGVGEALLFWSVAVIMVAAAIGVLIFRKAAYAALSMVTMMVGMAVLFFALEAPFNGAVQVIVYTGAIMMLFLFVIMMIGLGATDGYREQRKGYIITAVVLGIALAVFTVGALLHSTVVGPGKIELNPYSNAPVTSLAFSLFQNHWFTIQLSAMLLITAALGAILLTHSDRLGPKFNQANTAAARMTEYRVRGIHPGQEAAPGVYSKTNAIGFPAVAGDTLAPVESSVPRVLRLRGLDQPLGSVSPDVAEALQLVKAGKKDETMWSSKPKVEQSRAWGMGGAPAPSGLRQVKKQDVIELLEDTEEEAD